MINQNTKASLKATAIGVLWGLLDFFKYMFITAVIAFLITRLLFPIAYVPTESMENEFPPESFVICSKVSYWGENSPQRGDVILFRRSSETGDEKLYTKRVVGLPGDVITIENGLTYINGELYDEPWLKETPENSVWDRLKFRPANISVWGIIAIIPTTAATGKSTISKKKT